MVDRSVLQGTRGDRRRCTFLERGTIVSVLYFHFMTLHSTGAKVNFPGKSTFAEGFLTLLINHRRESKFAQGFFYFRYYYNTVCCISSFYQYPTATKQGHESRHFRCQCRVIVHCDISAIKIFLTSRVCSTSRRRVM